MSNKTKRHLESVAADPAAPPAPPEVHLTPRQVVTGLRHAAIQTLVVSGGGMNEMANLAVKGRGRMTDLLMHAQISDAAMRVFLQADHWLAGQPDEEPAAPAASTDP